MAFGENILAFTRGVLFNTEVGPLIIVLGLVYLALTLKDLKYKRKIQHLQEHVTIKGREVIRGSGISVKLKTTNGWKTGVFLGANKDGFLIIKTDSDSKIMVDPNYVSDIRVFDPN